MLMKCSFCSNEIERGTGKMYVQNDGRIFYFCSSKCQKGQFKLKHKGWEVKWTETFRRLKGEGKAGSGSSAEEKQAKQKEQKEKHEKQAKQ